jgi:23S rRNA (cytidine1920-2'-O)/16S rRNA (cytidine1409-2'-O)-methyltransferase
MRLDKYIYKNLNIQSRNKAVELIKSEKVKINNTITTKPSTLVSNNDIIEVDIDNQYVSRSANKLNEFIKSIEYNPQDLSALDIGSSTGGFTQVLLQHGIKSVDCVDVGSNQLHDSIRDNPQISVYENTDIRVFKNNYKYDLIVSDVSFISLLMIIEHIDKLALSDIILLYKPQFEVGKDIKRDKNGVVNDQQAIKTSMLKFQNSTKDLNWRLISKEESKVRGKNGNKEFFYYFKK